MKAIRQLGSEDSGLPPDALWLEWGITDDGQAGELEVKGAGSTGVYRNHGRPGLMEEKAGTVLLPTLEQRQDAYTTPCAWWRPAYKSPTLRGRETPVNTAVKQ